MRNVIWNRALECSNAHLILLHSTGLDIAYIKNGYVYHSRWDSEQNISPGVVQRGGSLLFNRAASTSRATYLVTIVSVWLVNWLLVSLLAHT